MRTWFLVALAVLCAWVSNAQDETLFGGSKRFGVFLGPTVEFASVNGESQVSAGAMLGLVFDDFYFGFYGQGAADYEDWLDNGNEPEDLSLAQGGLFLGWYAAQHKVVHPFLGARVGWGVVNVDLDRDFDWDDADHVFVVTPELGAELNLTRWFRMSGAVGYRFLNGVEPLSPLQDEDFRSWTFQLAFKFGWFGNGRRR